MAHLQSMMANHWGMKLNGAKPRPKDFMHTIAEAIESNSEGATIEQVAAILRNAAKGKSNGRK